MPVVPPFYTLDITDYGDVPDSLKKEAASEVADFIKTEVLSKLSDGDSPVAGRSFEPLSEKYAEDKHGGDTTPRLELSGDMLDALDVKIKGSKVTLFIRGSKQNAKASGHNQFTGGESDTLPVRRFIPFFGDGEKFTDDIEQGISEIVSRFTTNQLEQSSNILQDFFENQRKTTSEQRDLARELLGAVNKNVLPPPPDFSGDFDL